MNRVKTNILLIIILFSGVCEAVEPENEINPEYDITTTSLVINWYDSVEELQDDRDDVLLLGEAECEYRPEFNQSFCELWLVRPVASDDYYTFDTIGHELYHALVGAFHEE